jgi:multiple sugar transport system permease protein
MDRLKARLGAACMALLAIYVLVPLYWLVVAATKSTPALFATNTFVPSGVASLWTNLRLVLDYNNGDYRYWFVNSLVYALAASSLATYVATATGYAICKFKFVGRGALLATIVASLMIPSTVLIIPIFILEKFIGLTNSYEGVILPLVASPFGVYFMYIYSEQSLPNALLDSARVDGASELRIFHQVAIPVLVPGIVTIFLISFIGTWNNFFLPLVLIGNEHLFPLTVGLSIWLSDIHIAGAGQPLYPEVLLGSLISVLPMLLMFPFLRKYIARGLTFGALAAE